MVTFVPGEIIYNDGMDLLIQPFCSSAFMRSTFTNMQLIFLTCLVLHISHGIPCDDYRQGLAFSANSTFMRWSNSFFLLKPSFVA